MVSVSTGCIHGHPKGIRPLGCLSKRSIAFALRYPHTLTVDVFLEIHKGCPMKKFIIILLFGISLSGCSALAPVLQLVSTPTPQPPPQTRTPAPTVTLIPTQDLFATTTSTPVTFTPTDTPFLPDQPPTGTPTPLPTFGPPPNLPS